MIINKNLYLVIEITQLLYKNNRTYDDVKKILDILHDEFKTQRECLEYDDVNYYLQGRKTANISNKIIQPLNHVEGYF